MIKPTVGRVVWFFQRGKCHLRGDQPLAAMVACVWSDTCVNLVIFDGSGNPMRDPPTSILLVQDGTTVPEGGHYCMWMPYQVGQAAKRAATRNSRELAGQAWCKEKTSRTVMDPDLAEEFALILDAQKTPENALAILKDAMPSPVVQGDYAWSWHSSVACCCMDEGLSHEAANRAASRFMHVAFGVDTSKARPASSRA
jgi:hypothetical protein